MFGRSPLGGRIEPYHFGTPTKPLFGCYYEPQMATNSPTPNRDCGIVLCYPMGHEYLRSHLAYRQLALRLSRAGFHVLRFDFYGCGDSSGDCEQGEIRQWMDDISTAINEIRNRCRSGGALTVPVCLAGVRFGATLAMMTAAERGDIEGLVLWDAVVSGSDYLEELTNAHDEKFRYSRSPLSALRAPSSTGEVPAEILGFPFTDAMRTGLGEIDLLRIEDKPANNILLIESSEGKREKLKARLDRMNTRVVYQHLPSPQVWMEEVEKMVMPNQILQNIVSWASKEFS